MSLDLITVGRANMDLYSTDIGAPFEQVRNFEAMVGGSPTNIAISARRHGVSSAAFTGVGEDVVGDFVIDYLKKEGVVVDHVQRIPGKATSLALLGVQPPDHFPLLFYRDDPADIHLTVEQAATLPLADLPAVQLSGNAFSRGTCADAAWHIAAGAAPTETTVFLDLDLRPTDWSDPAEFGRSMKRLLPLVDVAIGTEEELAGALLEPNRPLGQSVSAAEAERLDLLVAEWVDSDGSAIVLKRGSNGATVFDRNGRIDVAGFPADVVNTVGAGDAFAGGLIRSRLQGLDWDGALRFANACGAIQVSRHGCSAAFPTSDEVETFLAHQGSQIG